MIQEGLYKMNAHLFTSFIITASIIGNVIFPLTGYAQELKRRTKKVSGPTKVLSPPTTPFSYIKKSEFCSPDGAKKMMEELVEVNDKAFNDVQDIKEEIEKSTSKTAIIQGVLALRNQYEKSISELTLDTNKKNLKPEIRTDLTNFKKLLRSGLTINALTLMMKDADLSSDQHLKMSHLCQKNLNLEICRSSSSSAGSGTSAKIDYRKKWILFGEDVHSLDSVLENFKTTFKRSGSPEDRAKLKGDVEKIIQSIPENIAPEKLLTIIKEKSPDLYHLLEMPIPGDTVMKCLDENNNKSEESLSACSEIISDPKSRTGFQELIRSQSQSMKTILGNKYTKDIEEVSQKRNDEMLKTFANLDELTIKQNATFKEFAQKTLEGIEKLTSHPENPSSQRHDGIALMFQPPPLDPIDSSDKASQNARQMAEAEKKSREFKEVCNFSKEYAPSTGAILTESQRIRRCQSIMEEVKPKLNALVYLHLHSLKDLESQLSKLKNGAFNDIELLKKFTAEKYICECTKKDDKISLKKSKVSLDQNTSFCQELNFSASFSINTIIHQAKDINDVLNKSFGLEIETDINRCENTFSKANMTDFGNVCSKRHISERFTHVCQIVEAEMKNSANIKTPTDYDKLHEENYVDFDPRLNREVVTPKKSTGSILAYGMLPTIATNFLPAWMNDFQTRGYTNQLTEQGLFIKQYQHTMTMYNTNPWMYGYNYFANPFLNFNTSTSLPTTSNTSGIGFGF